MELQELVERINRWKTRIAGDAEMGTEMGTETGTEMGVAMGTEMGTAVGMEEEAFARDSGEFVEDEVYESAEIADDAVVNEDNLDFEEMDLAEIPSEDSGILEAEPLIEETQEGEADEMATFDDAESDEIE